MMQDSRKDQFDVLLVGSGLGATACAHALACGGKRVGFVAGVGRPRSLEADGGLVDPKLVSDAFGDGAPLGEVVKSRKTFRASDVGSAPAFGAVEEMRPRRAYRRHEFERWARQRAIAEGAEYLEGFVEGQVRPTPDGTLMLASESGDQMLAADAIALCEGADPRIPMHAGLRPDYSPEDQLHFARTVVAQSMGEAIYRSGDTRTTWGMPIRVSIVPMEAAVVVSVAARIENVMRSNRSAVNALDDLLSSCMGAELGLQGERVHTEVELVAMRRNAGNLRLSQDGLLMGLDASGILDPREARRADVAIRSGMHLAAFLLQTGTGSWEQFAAPVLEKVRAVNPRWMDSPASGFIEESPHGAGPKETLIRRGNGLLRRLRIRE